MLHLPRRLTTALLWLAIALLPMRGWAASVMPMVAVEGPHGATVSAAEPLHTPPPCHGMAHAHTEADPMASDEPMAADEANAPSTTHTCSMCDLCHAGVLQTTPAAIALADLPQSAPPGAAPAAIEPVAPDGLFRPPRTTLA